MSESVCQDTGNVPWDVRSSEILENCEDARGLGAFNHARESVVRAGPRCSIVRLKPDLLNRQAEA